MPKLKREDIVSAIIADDKAMRLAVRMHKNLLKVYDDDAAQERKEFEERQSRLQASMDANARYFEERMALIDRRKQGVAAIIMTLEQELAEDLEVQPDGAITTLPMVIEVPGPLNRAQKGRFAKMMGLKGARA